MGKIIQCKFYKIILLEMYPHKKNHFKRKSLSNEVHIQNIEILRYCNMQYPEMVDELPK